MGDRVDVVADLADELAVGLVVEMADEMGRKCGVVEEFLEGESVEGDLASGREHRRAVERDAIGVCDVHRVDEDGNEGFCMPPSCQFCYLTSNEIGHGLAS